VGPAPVIIVGLDPVGIETAAIYILEEILPPTRKRDVSLPGIAFKYAPGLIGLENSSFIAVIDRDLEVKPAIAKDRLPGTLDRFVPGKILARNMNQHRNRIAAGPERFRDIVAIGTLEGWV
jgi:hypothetical protein